MKEELIGFAIGLAKKSQSWLECFWPKKLERSSYKLGWREAQEFSFGLSGNLAEMARQVGRSVFKSGVLEFGGEVQNSLTF